VHFIYYSACISNIYMFAVICLTDFDVLQLTTYLLIVPVHWRIQGVAVGATAPRDSDSVLNDNNCHTP